MVPELGQGSFGPSLQEQGNPNGPVSTVSAALDLCVQAVGILGGLLGTVVELCPGQIPANEGEERFPPGKIFGDANRLFLAPAGPAP